MKTYKNRERICQSRKPIKKEELKKSEKETRKNRKRLSKKEKINKFITVKLIRKREI